MDFINLPTFSEVLSMLSLPYFKASSILTVLGNIPKIEVIPLSYKTSHPCLIFPNKTITSMLYFLAIEATP